MDLYEIRSLPPREPQRLFCELLAADLGLISRAAARLAAWKRAIRMLYEEMTMRQEAGYIRVSMMLTDGRHYSRVLEVLLSL